MGNYYVSVNRGSDSTGTGTATNPWKTINKAIGSSPALTLSGTGDTLYIEPGVYRETIIFGLSPTSGGRLTIVGDSDGAGFLAGGYTTPVVGAVVDWRAWSDDFTYMTAACLSATSKNYVTVRNIKFIGGFLSTGCVVMNMCQGWTFQFCIGVSNPAHNFTYIFRAISAANQPLNLTIDRCILEGLATTNAAVQIEAPLYTADYLLNVVVSNCLIKGMGNGVQLAQTGTGSFAAGGVAVQNCTISCFTRALNIYQGFATVPASPVTVNGCLILSAGLYAGATGQLVENGNAISAYTPRSNVAAGANSVVSLCPSLDFGDGLLTGLPPQLWGAPTSVGVIGGWGNYGTTPAVDLTGRNRPEGAGSTLAAAGCYERHDTGARDVVYQDSGSPACLALKGPSSQERPIDVDATTTTLKIKVRWDGNHGDTAKPRMILLANPEIGIAAQTITATSTGGSGSTPNAYETLTCTIAPTAAGTVVIRMESRSAAGNGVAYFDTITLT